MMTVDQLADPHASLTDEEYFALHGTLNTSRIENLLAMDDALSEQGGVLNLLDEAKGCFPAEDFLERPLARLKALRQHLRGANKGEVETIIKELEDIQSATLQESEYGIDELKKAKDAIWVP